LVQRRKGSNFLRITGHGVPEGKPEIPEATTLRQFILLRCAG